MQSSHFLIVFALLFIPLDAKAELSLTHMTNPGHWKTEITTVMHIPGMNMNIPSDSTVTTCIAPEDDFSEAIRFMPNNFKGNDCSVLDEELRNNIFRYSMACASGGEEMEMQGLITFQSRNAFTSHVEIIRTKPDPPMTTTIDATSKRVGPCVQ